MANRQGLPHPTENDLLVGDEAADTKPVDADAIDGGAAGAVEAGRGGVGTRAQPSLASGGGDQLRCTTRRARRSIGLVGWCSSTTSMDS